RPETHGASADRQLAAEMGIHDVELPEATDGLHAAPAKDLDFDFGLDTDVRPQAAAIDVHDEMSEVVAVAPLQAPVEMPSFEALHESAPALPAPSEPLRPNPQVADAFAALLAREQGEPQALPEPEEPPPPPAPVMVQAVAPEITDAMLDQIAERVAERLNGSLFADHFRAAMASTVRDTVRSVVSETSEKLVRDEIARVKAQAERDAQ
ncbi:MAG: hypothetical protein ABI665_28380, partial [Vicinamibacterales bacterium]